MRVTMKLEIQVEKKDYDKDSAYLRIKGKNVLHTEHVRVGTYHSLEINLNHSFVLWKPVWDSAALEACKPSSGCSKHVQALNELMVVQTLHVQALNELMVVQTLLITDDLFKSPDVKARQKYVNLVKSVENSGGCVCILPADPAACKQLKELTGVAAILRFPLPPLEDV